MLDWRQVQMMLTLRSGGLAIVIYVVSLALTLTTTKFVYNLRIPKELNKIYPWNNATNPLGGSPFRLDDKISLYQFNSTWFEEIMEPKVKRVNVFVSTNFCTLFCQDLEDDLSSWRSLNLCRSVGVILGWLLVSLRPSTDLLHKHLKKLLTNNSLGKEGKKGEEVPKVTG